MGLAVAEEQIVQERFSTACSPLCAFRKDSKFSSALNVLVSKEI